MLITQKLIQTLCLVYEAKNGTNTYLFFFIYSCNALANSSLTLRAEPVLLTTNLIHSIHTSLSMFMEVLDFLLNCVDCDFVVVKVSGIYHKVNKQR